jgi:hypothetical protein
MRGAVAAVRPLPAFGPGRAPGPRHSQAREFSMTNPIRSKAEEKFAKLRRNEDDVIKQRDKAQKELMEKTARLKALRLAKEAADREAAAQAKAEKAAKAKK